MDNKIYVNGYTIRKAGERFEITDGSGYVLYTEPTEQLAVLRTYVELYRALSEDFNH